MSEPRTAVTAGALVTTWMRGSNMTERTCSLPECTRSVHSHDLCSSHAHRLRRYGDPRGTPWQPLVERFWPKVDRSGDCWLWTSTLNQNGYGLFGVGGRSGRMHLAPRVAWELTHGRIADGLQIRHACDTPACVNPAHLSLGTHADNTRDRLERNRQAKGIRFPHARLTDERVAEMRQTYDEGGTTQRELSKRYGVSQSVVSGIIARRRWKHVP